MKQNDATRIINVIDGRIDAKTFSGAGIEYTIGKVVSLDANNRASAYLYADSPYASGDFKLPNGLLPNVGDTVMVAIDKKRGGRWVEQVVTDTPNLRFDIVGGNIRFANGKVSDLTNGILVGHQNDATHEGGEIALMADTTGNRLWHIDVRDGKLRIFNAASGVEVQSDGVLWVQTSITSAGTIAASSTISTTGTVVAGALQVDKGLSGGTESRIIFPAQTNDPAFISHFENNNSAEMRFSASDDRGSTDFFSFGSTPGNVWSEGMRIRTDGVFEWGGDTNLYRNAANDLRTDDRFVAGSFYHAGLGYLAVFVPHDAYTMYSNASMAQNTTVDVECGYCAVNTTVMQRVKISTYQSPPSGAELNLMDYGTSRIAQVARSQTGNTVNAVGTAYSGGTNNRMVRLSNLAGGTTNATAVCFGGWRYA